MKKLIALAALAASLPVLADGVFDGATWIAAPTELNAAAPRFAKTFTVDADGPAEIAICGLGQYVATIDGRPLGRGDEFNLPGWTKTSKTCLYNVFRPILKSGVKHTLEITLGNGMYNVPNPGKGLYTKFVGSEGKQKLLVGGVVRTSLEGWVVTRSKISRTHVYAGDDIDATIDTSELFAPVVAEPPAGTLREAPFVCRLQETRVPVRTRMVSETELTLDFGQNAAYVPTVVARGPRGSRVEIDFSERPLRVDEMRIRETLTESGKRRNRSRCLFTLAGTGEDETFTVPFFYYGFRYMRVRLFPSKPGGALPNLVSAVARVVAADMPRCGSFECSNQLFNRIHDICWWAQRSNMQSVLTDCPHREKLGWQEQDHIHAEQVRWGWSAEKLFEKTCQDLADSQLPDGMCPDIAPEFTVFRGGFRHSIEWGSAIIQIPWQQYEWTGDDSLIRKYYDNMVAYHNYNARLSQSPRRGRYLTPGGLGDWFALPGNGGKPPRKTSIDFMATVYYHLNAVTLARCAEMLGKPDEAKAFREEAAKIKEAFNAKWWHDDGKFYENNTQTANSIAIATGLADPAEKDAIIKNIIADIRERGNALTAGEIGFPYLLQVLAESGHSDVIADMMFYASGSGYAYMIERGNTTCHEAWNSRESVSHNHFMYADIVNWFYGSLAGIKRTGVAFSTFKVAPVFLRGIDWVRAHHSLPSGDICVDWRLVRGKAEVTVVVPPGTTATVCLPGCADVEQRPGAHTYTVNLQN